MNEQQQQAGQWGLVEVMGHHRLAGFISGALTEGVGLVRVDVPEVTDDFGDVIPAFTKLFGRSAIFSITYTTEAIARAVAAKLRTVPVDVYDLPASWRAAIDAQRSQLRVAGNDDDVEVCF